MRALEGEAEQNKRRANKSVLVHVHILFKRLDSTEYIIRFANLYFIDNASTLCSKVIHAKTSSGKILLSLKISGKSSA